MEIDRRSPTLHVINHYGAKVIKPHKAFRAVRARAKLGDKHRRHMCSGIRVEHGWRMQGLGFEKHRLRSELRPTNLSGRTCTTISEFSAESRKRRPKLCAICADATALLTSLGPDPRDR